MTGQKRVAMFLDAIHDLARAEAGLRDVEKWESLGTSEAELQTDYDEALSAYVDQKLEIETLLDRVS